MHTGDETRLIIVSGLSGSGKTVALQALEDIGYYCIDNLPAILLPHFVTHLSAPESSATQLAAIGIDARNRHFLHNLDDSLRAIEALGIDYHILYLTADDDTLVLRYSETRRRHPLTDSSTSLREGIQLERRLIQSLADLSDMQIDTSRITPHELRSQVRNLAGSRDGAGMMLQLMSYGHKHGNPGDADFVFDVRCLPNPHWDAALRPLTGRDQAVIDFLSGHAEVAQMIEAIERFMRQWLPAFTGENRSYITLAVGCTGGRHRSVYIVERLAERLSNSDMPIQVRHRDLL